MNLVLVLGAVGVVYERAQEQREGRIPRRHPVRLVGSAGGIDAMLTESTLERGRLAVHAGAARNLNSLGGRLRLLTRNFPAARDSVPCRWFWKRGGDGGDASTSISGI